MLSRRANKQGLYIGLAVTVVFTAYAVLTSTKINNELILDMGRYNFTQHKYMLGVYSHLIVLIVGYLASFFFKTARAEKSLTLYGFLKKQ